MPKHNLIEPIIGGKTPNHLIIAVDFDGTICQHPGHDFPAIGDPIPHALVVLHRLREAGHRLMLWTMRDGDHLNAAARYLTDNGLCCWGWNENPDQTWSNSHKQYAHLYIDDAALGCPLVRPDADRAYVDWVEVELMLEDLGVLSQPVSHEYEIDFTLIGYKVDQELSRHVVEVSEETAIQWLRSMYPQYVVCIHNT